MWPYRLPRDEAEKVQLETERLRHEVRLQFRQMQEKEIDVEATGTRAFVYTVLIVLIVSPFLMNMMFSALFVPPF